MSRQNQAQKQRNSEAKKSAQIYTPVDNVIHITVKTPEDLFAIYPLHEMSENTKENLRSYWAEKFDFGLVDKMIYEGWWSTYDTSQYLFVFKAIDGSIQYVSNFSCPFSDDDSEVFYHECSPENAKHEIDSIIRTNDNFINEEATENKEYF